MNSTETINTQFTKNIEDLFTLFSSKKCRITGFLEKNFKENIHYIKNKNVKIKKHGGHNKINYYLTEKTFELVKNTFNLKHRYITKINENYNHINIIMSLENQTIGFIENSFKNIIEVKRQFLIKTYRVDLYFPKYYLVIECDEYNHRDRNKFYENEREQYIISLGNTIIRYNPNDEKFDLSFVFQSINKILFINEKKEDFGSIIDVLF